MREREQQNKTEQVKRRMCTKQVIQLPCSPQNFPPNSETTILFFAQTSLQQSFDKRLQTYRSVRKTTPASCLAVG